MTARLEACQGLYIHLDLEKQTDCSAQPSKMHPQSASMPFHLDPKEPNYCSSLGSLPRTAAQQLTALLQRVSLTNHPKLEEQGSRKQ